ALDGEREFEFGAGQTVTVTLTDQGPRVLDVRAVLATAAQRGLLIQPPPASAAPNGPWRTAPHNGGIPGQERFPRNRPVHWTKPACSPPPGRCGPSGPSKTGCTRSSPKATPPVSCTSTPGKKRPPPGCACTWTSGTRSPA